MIIPKNFFRKLKMNLFFIISERTAHSFLVVVCENFDCKKFNEEKLKININLFP